MLQIRIGFVHGGDIRIIELAVAEFHHAEARVIRDGCSLFKLCGHLDAVTDVGIDALPVVLCVHKVEGRAVVDAAGRAVLCGIRIAHFVIFRILYAGDLRKHEITEASLHIGIAAYGPRGLREIKVTLDAELGILPVRKGIAVFVYETHLESQTLPDIRGAGGVCIGLDDLHGRGGFRSCRRFFCRCRLCLGGLFRCRGFLDLYAGTSHTGCAGAAGGCLCLLRGFRGGSFLRSRGFLLGFGLGIRFLRAVLLGRCGFLRILRCVLLLLRSIRLRSSVGLFCILCIRRSRGITLFLRPFVLLLFLYIVLLLGRGIILPALFFRCGVIRFLLRALCIGRFFVG